MITDHFPSDHDPFRDRSLAFILWPTSVFLLIHLIYWGIMSTVTDRIQTNLLFHHRNKNQSFKTYKNIDSSKHCVMWERNLPIKKWFQLVDGWRELYYSVVCFSWFRSGRPVCEHLARHWSFSIALQQLLAVNNGVRFYDVSQADIHAWDIKQLLKIHFSSHNVDRQACNQMGLITTTLNSLPF